MNESNHWWIPSQQAGLNGFNLGLNSAAENKEERADPLTRLTNLWLAQGNPRGLLLHDEALAEAETWATQHAADLEEEEQDFLAECRAAQAAAHRQEQVHNWACCLAVLAVIVAALAWHFVMRSRGEAQRSAAALTQTKGELSAEQAARATIECRMAELTKAQDRSGSVEQAVRQDMREMRERAATAHSRALSARSLLMVDTDRTLGALLAVEALQAAQRGGASEQALADAGMAIYCALGHQDWQPDQALLAARGAVPVWLSAQGQALLLSEHGAEAFDALSGQRLYTLPMSSDINAAAWSNQGKQLVIIDRHGQGTIWDAASGALLNHLDSADPLGYVSWSLDDDHLGGLNRLGELIIWDATSGTELWRWRPSGGCLVTAVQWEEDRVRLLSDSQSLTVFDIESGEMLSQGAAHENGLTEPAAAFAHVLRPAEGEPLLYLLPNDALAQLVCSQLDRNLTAEEWADHVGPDVPYLCTCPHLPSG